MNLALQDLPGLSDLTRDYLTGDPKTSPFFHGSYTDMDLYASKAKELVNTERPHREQFLDILTDQNRQYNAGPETLANIKKLADANTLAIVTGQQTGLFGGPLYILYKSLTVIKLAHEMGQRLGQPVVPVFYLVSEDHDFEEIRWTGSIDMKNEYRRFVYTPQNPPDRTPAAGIDFDASIQELLHSLDDSLVNSEFKAAILDRLSRYYQPGQAMHNAFAGWYMDLLGKHGLVIFDSSDARVKPLLVELFERELHTGFSNRVLQDTNKKLEAAGYHTQITVQPNRPNLFLLENGRHGLERDGDGFISLNDQTHYSIQELLAHPEKLSPKVTMRPLVQDSLFPTLAYVGGPGEVAYWGQLGGLYDELGMTMPVVYPRAAFTLLEPKIRKHVDNHNLKIGQILNNPRETVKNILAAKAPQELTERFAELKSVLEAQFAGLKPHVTDVDPTLGNVVEKTAGNLGNQLSGLENKVMKAVEQRESVTANQLETVITHLLPENGLQERNMNMLYYLVKYDTALLDRLLNEINVGTFEHKIMEL